MPGEQLLVRLVGPPRRMKQGDRFYPCGDCGKPDAVIHGYVAAGELLAVVFDWGKHRTLVLCEACFEQRVAANA